MRAASQLPGREPTDVDDAPAPLIQMMMMIMMPLYIVITVRKTYNGTIYQGDKELY